MALSQIQVAEIAYEKRQFEKKLERITDAPCIVNVIIADDAPVYKSEKPSIKAIIAACANAFNVSAEAITSKTKLRKVTDARAIAAFMLANIYPEYTIQRIAFELHYNVQSSASFAIRKSTMLQKSDADFREKINVVKKLLA